MRVLSFEEVAREVAALCERINYELPPEVLAALERARREEASELGREALELILRNAEIARRERIPLCQDCGLAVIFVQQGHEVRVEGGLRAALTEGVRRGYRALRKSTCHPLTRRNLGDNTPPIVHHEEVPGDRLRIRVMAKGGGSENASALRMLSPSGGWPAIRRFVLETVDRWGANACPPLFVGVGIGGNLERAALLAKRALLRLRPHPELAAQEAELLRAVNDLGIGPLGYGGRNTALGVFLEMEPCHIASLPVAVNLQCHAARHGEVTL